MMKVPSSVRGIYSDLKEQYERLERQVDARINSIKDPRWHYERRIKELESFALKLETGRYPNPGQVDDFLACTLVVENLNSLAKAEQVICTEFEFCERRPKSNHYTSKQSDSFRFNDLRLYVKWQDAPGVRTTGLAGLLFEVQIKTFLQHAWSIATHDLIYKSDEKNWPKERIAYQVKAMLEHAEVSIQEAENLARSSNLPKTDTISRRISETIKFVSDLWPEDDLPVDKKRLAENIDNLKRCLKIDLQALRQILNRESELGRGTKTLNLSPYGVIVQSLINQAHDKVAEFLSSDPERSKFKIFFPKEIDVPASLQINASRNAITGINVGLKL